MFIAISGGSKLVRRHPGESSGPSNVLARQINRIYDNVEEALLELLRPVTIEEMDAEVRLAICAALVGGLADVGYFLFRDFGGFVKFLPGTLITLVSSGAITLSFWAHAQTRTSTEGRA